MMPHEIATEIVRLAKLDPVPQDDIDDLWEEMKCLVEEHEAWRLIQRAAGPTIH